MNDTTTQTEQRSAQLIMLDQQLALGAYLQALLKTPEEMPAIQPEPAAVVRMQVETAPAAEVQVVAVLPEPVPVSTPASLSVSTAESIPAPTRVAARVDACPYPDWAVGDFQCALFRVAGLTLALPLAKLNGVLPWDDTLVTPLPGHQPWFLGLREYQGQKVRLIDVANVIAARDGPRPDASLGKVILIGAGRWGLACDDVAEVVTLAPAAVKWRGQAGSRPWLAGTVIDRMCALVDADAFAQMLETEGAPVA
jgi:purine-binding chemotaxis protein CheW